MPYVVDEAAKVAKEAALLEYRTLQQQIGDTGRKKPDMIACKELSRKLTPPDAYGHIAGVQIGEKFQGRGDLAILGLHTKMMQGIMGSATAPCYAITLSGGYVDDSDEKDVISYTGMGGQGKGNSKSKRQVKDQQWTKGNQALRLSFEQGVPVRVCRAFDDTVNGKREWGYTYDGLYQVISATLEHGVDGFLVCKFKLQGIPGHCKAAEDVREVKHGIFANRGGLSSRFQNRQLVKPEAAARANKAKAPSVTPKGEEAAKLRKARMKALRERPGLKRVDISDGQEAVLIPLFNEFDDSEPEFTYIRDCRVRSEAVQDILRQGWEAMPADKGTCGVKLMKRLGCQGEYLKTGQLQQIDAAGIYECPRSCKSAACKRNQVVSSGIALPLEVFHTGTERGFGVRCSEDIPGGTFICSYVGEVVTDQDANADLSNMYLFDLDHFVEMHTEYMRTEDEAGRQGLPPLPFQITLDEEQHMHLSIDARTSGNVARFLNSSCNHNLGIQVVLLPSDSALYYRISFFAEDVIPAFTELTYDYGPNYKLKASAQA
ncbi:hypothetical protein WJX72_002101 [[Myrmecia] bisecta]|uniref:YDG domain-containing protein n=1 Tax=[Myrmecia] bisecta TaxID=41462 RepID=A0AAW1PSG8_9CHLO